MGEENCEMLTVGGLLSSSRMDIVEREQLAEIRQRSGRISNTYNPRKGKNFSQIKSDRNCVLSSSLKKEKAYKSSGLILFELKAI